ncbi:MAG: nucleotidyltransferase family protein [gamma proteobacterium symbiont of Bathyaustriella thionipta]|nr:nucleotidyltransferase family protein [gamma proteobacterium symbiont of Bathyaustriella thionipta]MCU7949348.1 nucleotidyltransferase family protein [gamma proteobacterium symbiont of Bathyaustriella thionipta]MCU7952650.1 nucleotidyltransferase family protein [gamma proteobacterium symbiont of Bathyaustriella thionipta]MCU7955527.1 nucleotidyltransferase family protein [gamma proteobacterium symbiont of Bathyaustriella thionipta]MCU7968579.1 nucleotidyltransferase family protein [gamma pro
MKAMILAAGRGERMRPLTDTTPKPLLKIAGKSLIEYHIEGLVKAGITELIINHAWLGDQIEVQLGDGSSYGASIQYSREGQALETAGGIKHALPFFADEPFIVVNGDVFSDYPFTQLVDSSKCLQTSQSSNNTMAHLVMVNNPEHHCDGDFYCLNQLVYDQLSDALLAATVPPLQRYTFSGIACYHPDFFRSINAGKQALAPMLRHAMTTQQVTGEIYQGKWWDIGTPERLEQLNLIHKN